MCRGYLWGLLFYRYMNELQLFNSPEFGEVRVVMSAENEPLFCALDVAKALMYKNPAKAVIQHCKGVTVLETPTQGGVQQVKFITEPNVYRLVMKSKAPKAEMFQDWVYNEVLPSIRKTGGYMVTKQDDTPEMIMARAVMVAQDTIKRYEQRNRELEVINKNQARQIGVMQHKADFYDTIIGSSDLLEMKDVAKVLDMGIGRNNLFKFLIEHKVLDRHKHPYQLYVDKRWFKSIPVYFDDPRTGQPSLYLKTMVYPLGIDGIRQLLKNKGYKKNKAQDNNNPTDFYR